jgi:hypothetical protein
VLVGVEGRLQPLGHPTLHQQTGGPTAGCVSLNPADLVAVLRWLRPGTRIAMGPSS